LKRLCKCFSEYVVCREIEKNIDTVNNLRRDKYIIEGKLKKYVEFSVGSQIIESYFAVVFMF